MAEIINDVSKGSIKQPKDINEVFVLANTRLVVSRGGKHNHGSTFATIEAHSMQVESVRNKETTKASKGSNEPKKTSGPQRNKKKTTRNRGAAPASRCGKGPSKDWDKKLKRKFQGQTVFVAGRRDTGRASVPRIQTINPWAVITLR